VELIKIKTDIVLSNMEQIEKFLLEHKAKHFFTVTRSPGRHCIDIRFDHSVPGYIAAAIKFEVRERCYSGIKIIDDCFNRNLWNFRICLDCEDTICYMNDLDNDFHLDHSGISEY
jgi:hypothetical protein